MSAYYQDTAVTLYHGDALSVLKSMKPKSVQCVVTSPPYWRMRDYEVEGQMGMEETPELYTAAMVGVFKEVWRVLRDDGTIWVNLGDCYASGGWGGGADVRLNRSRTWAQREKLIGWRGHPKGLKHKDMVGIPWRFAFAMQSAGWYLRSDIIWEKPNVLPESVIDRPTKSHEHIFLMSKKPKYYYDAEGIKVPVSPNTHERGPRVRTKMDKAKRRYNRANTSFIRMIGGPVKIRNRRDVWKVPSLEARLQYRAAKRFIEMFHRKNRDKGDVWTIANRSFHGAHFSTFPPEMAKVCILAGCPIGGIVLDPFAGSGTACAVAKEFGRKSVGIDLNSEFLDMAKIRLRQDVLDFSVEDKDPNVEV